MQATASALQNCRLLRRRCGKPARRQTGEACTEQSQAGEAAEEQRFGKCWPVGSDAAREVISSSERPEKHRDHDPVPRGRCQKAQREINQRVQVPLVEAGTKRGLPCALNR